jgi:hypothetical protein
MHWAFAWVGAQFTANVQSTQRVEKAQHLIKRTVGRTTGLSQLLEELERMASCEAETAAYITHRSAMCMLRPGQQCITGSFSSVDAINETFLASYAVKKMRQEMASAVMYDGREEEDLESLCRTVSTLDPWHWFPRVHLVKSADI